MHVGVQTTGLRFRQCRKLWLPQVQCSDKVGRPCDFAATACLATGGATDSVHRRSQRTIQLQQRRTRFQRWFGGGEGLLLHFSRSSGLSWS